MRTEEIFVAAGIIVSTLLVMTGILAPLGTNLMQSAEAYVRFSCSQQGPTITYRADSSVPSGYLSAIHLSMANWNNAPVNMFLDEVTSSEKITIKAATNGNNGITAITSWPVAGRCNPSTGYMNTPVTITLNTSYLDGYSNQQRQNTIAHETGHAIGLDHADSGVSDSDAQKTLMYSTNNNYVTYKIYVPVLDDIRAAQAWYGTVTSTSECTEYNQNGDVVYTGTCSSGSPALPMTEKVTTAGAGNRAFASQFSSGQSMPSVGTMLMMTKVQPSTLYRFSLGTHSGSNVADSFNRMATIELDNNGIYASYINTGGSVTTVTIWSGTPSTSTTYYLEVVVEQGSFSTPTAVYAYKDDGGGTDAPTYLGSASFDSGVLWNSYSMWHGTGVWTDSGSSPLSNYQVKEYYNRLQSYT